MNPPARAHMARGGVLLARDVHQIPYLGGPEDRMRDAFMNSYGLARDQLRTPYFADHLAALSDPAAVMAWLDEYMDRAGVHFHGLILPTYAKVTAAGAALGHVDLSPEPMAKAAVEPVTRPRRSFLNRRPERATYGGPRLHGLRETPIPRPHHSFNADERHIRAAEALSLNLISHVNKGQRTQIRATIVESFRRGVAAPDTANRIANVVGLFPRWQLAVRNLHRAMLRNKVPVAIADRRAQEYSDELVKKRSVMIARTELMRSMNTGRLAGWHDLADRGFIDAKKSEKQWQGSIDNAICPECEYLSDPHGDGSGGVVVVGIDTPFDTEYGKIVMPPAHPHCRCSPVIRPVMLKGNEDWPEASQGFRDGDWVSLNDPEIAGLTSVLASA